MVQCTCPVTGYYSVEGGFSLNSRDSYHDRPLTVRCGRCMGCRLDRASTWATRSVHESSMYDQNIFLTMTYDDEHLPYAETLVRKHVTDFFKRLKSRYPSETIRQLYCGEYGGETRRPHYHALIFNFEPSDGEFFFQKEGRDYYRSDKIDALWGLGHCNYANEVTFQSAAYVAGYVTKKIRGDQAEEHYQWIDESTGEIIQRLPEFQGQSLRPGLGAPWIEKFYRDVYPSDFVVIDGQKRRPPRFYDQKLELLDPSLYRRVMINRQKQQTEGLQQPDKYHGTGRQMYARDKIIKSRQRDRNDQ